MAFIRLLWFISAAFEHNSSFSNAETFGVSLFLGWHTSLILYLLQLKFHPIKFLISNKPEDIKKISLKLKYPKETRNILH